MVKTRHLLVALLISALAIAGVGIAAGAESEAKETNLALLLETIRANRRALVAVNLDLSADEAAKFWPLYERYQEEMNAIGDRLARIVEDYTAHFGDLSNERALQLVEDHLSAEADRVKVRRTYLPEFAKVLPGRTVARFYQIENKMDAVLRYDLAATIPVIEEGRGAAAK
jgi:hypothetical protein